ncbi:metallophosphoesterase [Massilia sp. MB5]|uniref:metallophosphoesterase family protein n=1 Tax=Massilia sp. MB5 TaxID=2919578 RepID=UPI001F0F2EC6|nr:metallophosphoesterase [Massilia sp. MB5]UMR31438.1 metallophosphoesterase [Massilia sp. MB5]
MSILSTAGLRRAFLLPLAAGLGGCAALAPPAAPPAPSAAQSTPLPPGIEAAYVLLGEEGRPVARVLSSAAACPAIDIDGQARPMQLRAPAATLALRPSAAGADSKPSVFPLLTCEAELAPATRRASVAGHALPLPRAEVQRIAVIGDTGCRLKKADNAYQACNDPQAFPFAAVAAAAAAWQPDLVLHVGDYHYRENPCPEGNAGCANSPWGYGWDAWREDFFRPAAPLLQAAPWVAVRGNHESCARAGQGWWRLLDPRPLQAGRDCNLPADDSLGDYSDPYAVPLGGASQLLVIDTAATSWRGLKASDTGYERYRATYRRLAQLAAQAPYNLGANHHPIFAVGADRDKQGRRILILGDKGLHDSFGSLNPLFLPDGVQAMLSGHVHLWQQLSFSSPHPSQLVAGFSGTAEDTEPLPPLPDAAIAPAPGAVLEHFSAWLDGFGFMGMERGAPGEWRITVFDRQGAVQNRCLLQGRHSQCEQALVR